MVPSWLSAVHTGARAEPRFVKTWMTPADASVPYSVLAAGPEMISMRSMSLGLSWSNRLGLLEELPADENRSFMMRMPSIMMIGEPLLLMLFTPRIVISDP